MGPIVGFFVLAGLSIVDAKREGHVGVSVGARAAGAGQSAGHLRESVQYELVLRGNMSVPHPAFASLPCQDYPSLSNDKHTSCPAEMAGLLFITSFGFLSSADVHVVNVTDPKTRYTPIQIPGARSLLKWPNRIFPLPKGGISRLPLGLLLGDGFLVPGKSSGGLWIVDLEKVQDLLVKAKEILNGTLNRTQKQILEKRGYVQGRNEIERVTSLLLSEYYGDASPANSSCFQRVSVEDSGWFYHKAFPYDVDGDGRLDLVAPRAQSPPMIPWAQHQDEVVWFRQDDSPFPWKPRTLIPGPNAPGFLFTPSLHKRPDKSTALWISAAEFYGERVVIYSEPKTDGNVTSNIIDEKFGPGFGCSWMNLDAKGHSELVATTHKTYGGGVYAYEWDDDADPTKDKPRVKHTLASGFTPKVPIPELHAAPGGATGVYPRVEMKRKGARPYVIVSGDDEDDVVILTPVGPHGFEFSRSVLGSFNSDVGGIATGDIDSNGFTDVFIPLYDAGTVLHYEFQEVAE